MLISEGVPHLASVKQGLGGENMLFSSQMRLGLQSFPG